jgi:hypothetical protein
MTAYVCRQASPHMKPKLARNFVISTLLPNAFASRVRYLVVT